MCVFPKDLHYLPALAIPSAVHSTPSVGELYLPWVYYSVQYADFKELYVDFFI